MHLISTGTSTSTRGNSSKVVNRNVHALSSSGIATIRTLESAISANYQNNGVSRDEISSSAGINGTEHNTWDGFTDGYKDQPYATESSNNADNREDNLSETYSLVRERNILLNRLEQVRTHIQW